MKRTLITAGLTAGIMITLAITASATASAESRPTSDDRKTSAKATGGQNHHGSSRSILDYH